MKLNINSWWLFQMRWDERYSCFDEVWIKGDSFFSNDTLKCHNSRYLTFQIVCGQQNFYEGSFYPCFCLWTLFSTIVKFKLIFFIKIQFLKDISPFPAAINTLVLDFWWFMSCVSEPEWIPHIWVLSAARNGLLSFTSGCDTCRPLAVYAKLPACSFLTLLIVIPVRI